MDKFKSILRKGLQLQAERISLVLGQPAAFFLGTNKADQPEFGVLDQTWILNLFQALFSQPGDQESFNSGQTVVSSFQLQGIGKVSLVAEKTPQLGLQLFMPPSGEAQCQQYLNAPSEAPPAAMAPPPPPPIPPPPPVEFGNQSVPFSGAGQMQNTTPQPASPQPGPGLMPDGPGTAPGGETGDPFSLKNSDGLVSDFNMFGSPPASNQVVEGHAAQDPQNLSLSTPAAQPEMSSDSNAFGLSLDAQPAENQVDFQAQEAGLGGLPGSVGQVNQTQNLDMFASQHSLSLNGAQNSAPAQSDMFDQSSGLTSGTPETMSPQSSFGQGEIQMSSAPSPMSASSGEMEPYGHQSGSVGGHDKEELNFDDMFLEHIPGTISMGTGHNPIDGVLKSMIENRASDLHLTNHQPIILRVDGDICRARGNPLSGEVLRDYLFPIMPDIKKTEFMETWDTDFAYEVENLGRFRVNMFRDHHGVGAVFRHIPSKVLSAEDLGLPVSITKLCKLSKGLVLVTGPTGSGKSTTLAAMIDLINSGRSEHILTIEDPIEFVHQQKKCLINQREVGKHTDGFDCALKAALREDPDIVLVGELRDLETTSIALETAETGHLVFATLHTNTAISTVDRIIDQFPSDQQRIIRNMLASSMKGVIAQTLCKRKGGGRVAAYEILIPNEAVASMIREGKNHMIGNHMQTQQADGNILMNESLTKLVTEDIIEYKEAWSKAIDKKDFEELAKRKRIPIPGGD